MNNETNSDTNDCMEYYLKSFEYICSRYWGERLDDVDAFIIPFYETITDYYEKELSPVPYLEGLLEKYPDAPDFLNELVSSLRKERRYIEALKVSHKLVSLYPHEEIIERHEKLVLIVKYDLISDTDEFFEWFRQFVKKARPIFRRKS